MADGSQRPRSPGRPRAEVDGAVFAATLATIDELGYTRATVDRIAAAAGVAKTTIYRRWPSKGDLVSACLVDAFGPVPVTSGADRRTVLADAIRWAAGRIAEPGVGAAFAGVFTDAIGDPGLRETLEIHLQEPYRQALEQVLDEPSDRVLFIIDVAVGSLLHRLGISGRPMADDDLDDLIGLLVQQLN